MKYFIVISLILSISSFTGFGQQENHKSTMVFCYEMVTEFKFDKDVQDFVAKNSTVFSDSIRISEREVFVKGYLNKPDKTFVIINVGKERTSGRKKFTCQDGEELYAVVVSPDKKYITIIGVHYKYIYKIKTSKSEDK